jgi:hypothetical protein
MPKLSSLLMILIPFVALTPTARSSTMIGLADWCFSINGDTSTFCNGAGSLPQGSAFDTTLEPDDNMLGSVTFTLGAGPAQFVSAYMDYDVDDVTLGAFDDFGSVSGAPPTNYAFELDDPNNEVIFDDFASNALTNANNVGTGSPPPTPCCDVAWAISLNNINGPGDITITVSATQPTSGFYLQQTNNDTGDSIYLTEDFSPGPATPEPATWGMSLAGLTGLLVWRRRKS